MYTYLSVYLSVYLSIYRVLDVPLRVNHAPPSVNNHHYVCVCEREYVSASCDGQQRWEGGQ